MGTLVLSKLLFRYVSNINKNVSKIKKKNFQTIVYLRFFQFKNVIDRLKFLSIPSHHHFISFRNLSLITNKKTFILLSTNKGLKTLSECKKQKLGGKLLFLI